MILYYGLFNSLFIIKKKSKKNFRLGTKLHESHSQEVSSQFPSHHWIRLVGYDGAGQVVSQLGAFAARCRAEIQNQRRVPLAKDGL